MARPGSRKMDLDSGHMELSGSSSSKKEKTSPSLDESSDTSSHHKNTSKNKQTQKIEGSRSEPHPLPNQEGRMAEAAQILKENQKYKNLAIAVLNSTGKKAENLIEELFPTDNRRFVFKHRKPEMMPDNNKWRRTIVKEIIDGRERQYEPPEEPESLTFISDKENGDTDETDLNIPYKYNVLEDRKPISWSITVPSREKYPWIPKNFWDEGKDRAFTFGSGLEFSDKAMDEGNDVGVDGGCHIVVGDDHLLSEDIDTANPDFTKRHSSR